MSYIDPEYYNAEKLTEAQRAEIGVLARYVQERCRKRSC